ncbi:MAG: hypothetical protein AB7G06_07720 [Bdellovibrionales bacterium]
MRYLVFLLAVILPLPAAASACYDSEQAAAEAAIRIHSEIMVTALTCQYSQTTGDDLRNVYVAFGQKHNERLRRAEQSIIGYYQKKQGRGVAELDRLRTILGNEYAERIAAKDPLSYCKMAADSVVAAGQWTPAQFEQAILRAAASSSATEPLCTQVAKY